MKTAKVKGSSSSPSHHRSCLTFCCLRAQLRKNLQSRTPNKKKQNNGTVVFSQSVQYLSDNWISSDCTICLFVCLFFRLREWERNARGDADEKDDTLEQFTEALKFLDEEDFEFTEDDDEIEEEEEGEEEQDDGEEDEEDEDDEDNEEEEGEEEAEEWEEEGEDRHETNNNK